MISQKTDFRCTPAELIAYLCTLPTDQTVEGWFSSRFQDPKSIENRRAQLRIEALKLCETRSKIEAIKWIRTATGCGLKEAKDAVESWLVGGNNWEGVNVP